MGHGDKLSDDNPGCCPQRVVLRLRSLSFPVNQRHGSALQHSAIRRQFRAHQSCALDHGFHFSESNFSRQVLEAAIWGHNDAIRAEEGEGTSYPCGNGFGCFDFVSRKIEHAEGNRFALQFLEDGTIERRLRRFNRDLIYRRLGQLRKKRISRGAFVNDCWQLPERGQAPALVNTPKTA